MKYYGLRISGINLIFPVNNTIKQVWFETKIAMWKIWIIISECYRIWRLFREPGRTSVQNCKNYPTLFIVLITRVLAKFLWIPEYFEPPLIMFYEHVGYSAHFSTNVWEIFDLAFPRVARQGKSITLFRRKIEGTWYQIRPITRQDINFRIRSILIAVMKMAVFYSRGMNCELETTKNNLNM